MNNNDKDLSIGMLSILSCESEEQTISKWLLVANNWVFASAAYWWILQMSY